MKHSVLDVLIYLFENCMDDEIDVVGDRDVLHRELCNAGFEDRQVSKAFDWLQALAVEEEDFDSEQAANGTSMRIYSAQEQGKINIESRGLLYFLEQLGVLDSRSRELVIDRVMDLESEEIDLEQLKWIVLMVLFNQPGQEESFVWMENLVMDETRRGLH